MQKACGERGCRRGEGWKVLLFDFFSRPEVSPAPRASKPSTEPWGPPGPDDDPGGEPSPRPVGTPVQSLDGGFILLSEWDTHCLNFLTAKEKCLIVSLIH